MPTTTHAALEVDIRNAVRAIVPDFTGAEWHWVATTADVGSAQRRFTVIVDNVTDDVVGGFYMSGLETWSGDLSIVTGYGGLSETDYRAMSTSDRRQLKLAIVTTAIPGTHLVQVQSPEDHEDSKPGHRVIAHRFTVQFHISNRT